MTTTSLLSVWKNQVNQPYNHAANVLKDTRIIWGLPTDRDQRKTEKNRDSESWPITRYFLKTVRNWLDYGALTIIWPIAQHWWDMQYLHLYLNTFVLLADVNFVICFFGTSEVRKSFLQEHSNLWLKSLHWYLIRFMKLAELNFVICFWAFQVSSAILGGTLKSWWDLSFRNNQICDYNPCTGILECLWNIPYFSGYKMGFSSLSIMTTNN